MTVPQSWRSLIDLVRSSAAVSTVYGAPIEAHGRTLIPVARVAYGFGAGHGPLRIFGTAASGGSPDEESSGGGLGGGASARPVGVVELGPDGARFVVFRDRRALAAATVGGFLLGVLVGRLITRT